MLHYQSYLIFSPTHQLHFILCCDFRWARKLMVKRHEIIAKWPAKNATWHPIPLPKKLESYQNGDVFFWLTYNPMVTCDVSAGHVESPALFSTQGTFHRTTRHQDFHGHLVLAKPTKTVDFPQKIYMGGRSPADSKRRPSNGQRPTCAHKTDSVVHTDFLTQMYTQNWLTCAHKLEGWGGAREEKGRIYQPDPLPNFIVGTQPLLDFLRLTLMAYHHTSTFGGGARLGKIRVGSTIIIIIIRVHNWVVFACATESAFACTTEALSLQTNTSPKGLWMVNQQ